MDTILQGLLDLAGVNAALVLDAAGRLVAFRGKAVYDRGLCEEVGPPIVKAIDSVALQQEDWEAITAQFADGKLLVRTLGTPGGAAHYLALVADGTLNPSFATVAIRVAANKLRKALEGGPASSVGATSSVVSLPPPSASQVLPDSRAVATTGVSWRSGSSAALSGTQAVDPPSAAFLSRCTKELARSVGPMAKVYVQEAIRRISPDGTFSLALRARLTEDLAGLVESPSDRAQFLKALETA